MQELLSSTLFQAIALVAALLVFMIVGYGLVRYAMRRFRDRTGQDAPTANDLMANFREMRQRGDISDAEYRTIKTVLHAKLREEFKQTDDKD